MNQQIVVYILLLSLLLQNCGNPSNQIIPIIAKEKAQTKTIQERQIDMPLADKQLTAEVRHLIACHEQEEELKVDITIYGSDNSKKPTVCKNLPLRVAKDMDLAQLPHLSNEKQKRFIHVSLPKKGQSGSLDVMDMRLLSDMFGRDEEPVETMVQGNFEKKSSN